MAGDKRLFVDGWENVALTAPQLADTIDAGVAYTCELNGPRRKESFQASGVLSVDIDGGRRIEEVLEDPFVREHLTMLYKTVSHTEQEHHFRLVFATGRTIEDPAEMTAATRSLALRMNGDPVVTDAARLFYGSRGSKPQVWDRGLPEEVLDELIKQSLDAASVANSGCSPDTTTSRLSLNPNQLLKTAGGAALRMADLSAGDQLHCPYHHDTNPSAFVVMSRSGTGKGLHCRACKQTFWQAGTSFVHDFFEFERAVEQARDEFTRHQDWGPLRPFLGPQEHFVREGLKRANIIIQDEPFLRLERLEKGLTFILSGKGSGKTEFLSRELASLPGSVLLISHRISLIQQTCKRLGLDCYLDFNGRLQNKRLGICWDSLGRLEGHGGLTRYKTIIIDEGEQVLAHTLADTMSGEVRDRNFKIFAELLKAEWRRGNTWVRGVERVVALDADLGFTTFATLTRLVNNGVRSPRPTHIVINRHRKPGHIQVFDDRNHLIGDLIQSLRDEKRVFVVSNSKGQIDALAEAIASEFGPSVRLLKITSQTATDDKNVASFITNPSVEALKYNAILASPTIGTGVDITFEGQAKLIDVVYGLFKDGITTHFDIDQQLGRVRHPGEVKVYVSPRRFHFDTALDVVRSDIHRLNLFKSVLLRYDDGKPVYDMEDPMIEMASLIVSRERASKNNLKRHFIEHKEHNGFTVEIVRKDERLSGEGAVADRLGRELSQQQRIDRLMAAEPLPYGAFQSIEERIKRNGDVTVAERWSMARTRIELFYRARISPEIIALDAERRHRERVRLFESILRAFERSEWSELRQRLTDAAANPSMSSRFQRNPREAVDMLLHLLGLTPILKDDRFDPDSVFIGDELSGFAEEAVRLKPFLENLLGTEVRRDVLTKPMAQLNAILGTIGLRCINVAKTRAKAVAGGRSVRSYCLDRDALKQMEALAAVRRQQDPWPTLYEIHGWDPMELKRAMWDE